MTTPNPNKRPEHKSFMARLRDLFPHGKKLETPVRSISSVRERVLERSDAPIAADDKQKLQGDSIGIELKDDLSAVQPVENSIQPAPLQKTPATLVLPVQKAPSRFSRVLSSIGHFGLGKQRMAFIENLATMMDAGLPLLDAIRALQRETRQRSIRKILGNIVTSVEMGNPLWRAMDAQCFFSQQQVAMVRVGEEAGNLVENMQYLAIQEEKERALKSKVKTAMIYPIIVLTLLTSIVLGLGIFVLPNLIQVIVSLDVPLPIVTRMIMAVTHFFTTQSTTGIPLFFVGFFIFILLAKFTPLKVVTQWVLLKIPGIGSLVRYAVLSRFGVVMGGLLQAGVPVTEALDSLVDVTSLWRYKKFYVEILEHIKLGDSFTTTFHKVKLSNKCFPISMQQLIMTGEQSGSLTKVMLKIAEINDKRASEIAEKLPVILEPMLLLIIGSLVGTIALGILAPIYSVVGNLS